MTYKNLVFGRIGAEQRRAASQIPTMVRHAIPDLNIFIIPDASYYKSAVPDLNIVIQTMYSQTHHAKLYNPIFFSSHTRYIPIQAIPDQIFTITETYHINSDL